MIEMTAYGTAAHYVAIHCHR